MARRCFIGLEVPIDDLPNVIHARKKLLISADKRNIEVQWSKFENYHITLKFLGETTAKQLSNIVEKMKLAAAEHSPLSLKLSGVGAFPDENHARVLWLGTQNSRALRALQSDLEESMIELGYPTEAQAFKPHLTVGRIRKARKVTDMISPLVRKTLGKFTAQNLVLYESQVRGYSPFYSPLKKIALKGTKNR